MAGGMQDRDWRALAFSITQGDCILMLGPDAVTETVGGKAVPVMSLFGEQLRETMKEKAELPEDWHFSQVAQAFKNEFGGSDLLAAASDFFSARDETPDQALLDLSSLPFRLVINTTPGTQMEKAFLAQKNKKPVSDWYNFSGPGKDLVHEGTVQQPLVYHLYGCVKELKSLVLSEDDLLDFLVKVISNSPGLPNNIRSEFPRKDTCFLFLGFGLKHWYLRILLHVRYGSRGGSRSFALEKFDDAMDQGAVERTKSFFQQGHKIHFFDMDLRAFAAELRQRVDKQGGALAPGAEPELPADAPRVFLCHASEDKEYARQLHKRLAAEGIKAWLDVRDITGGADWDEKIERTIDEEVDFFLVLQSKALLAKEEGYVNKEIKWALNRQDYFRETAFIFPVLIEQSEKLNVLDHLQTLNLTVPGEFERLARDIKRNHQIRKKRS